MNAVTDLGPEDVVDQLVLGDTAESGKRRRRDHRCEVVAIAGNVCLGAGNPGLDPRLQLVGSCRHTPSVATSGRRYTH